MTIQVPCMREARLVREAQNAASPTTSDDSEQLQRNMTLVEQAIQRFNDDVAGNIPNLKPTSPGVSVDGHPPRLTSTERTRFTRSYYQLWALILLGDTPARQERLQSLRLQQLYLIFEVTHLNGPIGDLQEPPESVDAAARKALRATVWAEIEQKFQRLFKRGPVDVLGMSIQNGPAYGFICLFDYFQEMFRDACTGGRTKLTDEIKALSWRDGEDDDENAGN